jgi:hypothetical protein
MTTPHADARTIEHTDWPWITREPWAAAAFEFAAIVAWTLLAASLLAPGLTAALLSATVIGATYPLGGIE